MDVLVVGSGSASSLADMGQSVFSGNISNLVILAWFIAVVIGFAFAKGLIFKGLRGIGF